MEKVRIEYCDVQDYDDSGFLRIYLVEDHGDTKLLDVDALHSISMADVVRLLHIIDPLIRIENMEPEGYRDGPIMDDWPEG